MRVAVAGGTGWTGSRLVGALRQRGDEVVVLARSTGVDLTTGAGLAPLLEGVDAVIDVTNRSTQRATESVRFFEAATTHLLEAEHRAGVAHHVVLSIVGIDRVDLGYYRGKRRQEELALAGPVPATVLRATQFHEFADQMLDTPRRWVLAPKMLCQPIALDEVVDHLADLARGEPLGPAPELAGPEGGLRMDDMVTRLARRRGDRRPRLRIGLPGRVGRQIRHGGLMPNGEGPRGTLTFEQWLARQGHQVSR